MDFKEFLMVWIIVALVILILQGSKACADDRAEFAIDIHGASLHINTDEEFSETNPGIGFTRYTGNKFLMVGTYKNSINNQSWYAGAGIQSGLIGFVAGIVTGYHVSIAPVILPRVSIGILNIYFIPEIKDVTPAAFLFSLSVEVDVE